MSNGNEQAAQQTYAGQAACVDESGEISFGGEKINAVINYARDGRQHTRTETPKK